MNIFDYIEKYNDKIDNINTLDAIIFTRLSYLHIEDLKIKLPIKVKDLITFEKDMKCNHNDAKLINLLSKSERFKDIVIKRYKYIEDRETEEVFKAITIELNNDLFIAFRGTGKNPIDFKEDMNMSFKIVPSCIEGVKYLEEEKKFNKLFISGHSKGGHIAVFASSHTTFFNKVKIEKVFNFDGPGHANITKEFKSIENKVINYFPEASIVGRIMNSVGEIIPIKTKKGGIEAHSIYNWEVKDNNLIKGELSKNSNLFHEECLNILKVIPKDKREIVINYIFSLMLKGEFKNIKELDLVKVKELINNTPKLEKNEKDELMKFFKVLFKCSMPELNYKKN